MSWNQDLEELKEYCLQQTLFIQEASQETSCLTQNQILEKYPQKAV